MKLHMDKSNKSDLETLIITFSLYMSHHYHWTSPVMSILKRNLKLLSSYYKFTCIQVRHRKCLGYHVHITTVMLEDTLVSITYLHYRHRQACLAGDYISWLGIHVNAPETSTCQLQGNVDLHQLIAGHMEFKLMQC